MSQIYFKPIGIIHSPFTKLEGMPIQPSAAQGIKGHIVIHQDYVDGIRDLDGFSHIYLIYHLHLSHSFKLRIIPFLDNQQRGVFSTRAPNRPNPIGLSVVNLIKIESNIIEIANVDIVDGTPLLDIKPYVQEMNMVKQYRTGWLSKYSNELKSKRSDKRFR
jgi:tRNA-Thr(GGU) m(6)t(6)A37 methyltransferase TsaA